MIARKKYRYNYFVHLGPIECGWNHDTDVDTYNTKITP